MNVTRVIARAMSNDTKTSATSLARVVLVAGLVTLGVGCTVGPNYSPPVAPAQDVFENAGSLAAETAAADVMLEELAWWGQLGDDQLVDLIERAMRSNLDLEIAESRLLEARAARRAAGGRLLPGVNSVATGGTQRASGQGPGPLAGLAEAGLADLVNDQFTFSFEAAWEIDLFGRLRRAREASQARLESVEEAYRATALLVASEVASAYVQLRGTERRLELAKRNLRIQQDSLEVIEGKVDTGLTSPIDFERGRGQLESTRAALAPLRAEVAAAKHRLAVLLGETPSTLEDSLVSAPVPEPPAAIASGLPADLIRRRPDLRQAERAVHAATADVGTAIAERFPQLSIGGSRGFESGKLSDLLESASRTWSLGPRLVTPIFQGPAAQGRRRRFEGAPPGPRRRPTPSPSCRRWRRVESLLVAYEEARNARASLVRAAEASAAAEDYAEVLYEEGLRDFLVLLDAQRSQTAADDALALAETNVALQAVSLLSRTGWGLAGSWRRWRA